MIISAHLNYFSIEECGLYKHNSRAANSLEVSETFQLIYDWVQGKPMEDTIPWDPESSKTGAPKCYCHDFYKCEDTGEYLFVLWKSETENGGTIWGAQADSKTGNSNIVEYTGDYRGRKLIWGRPCYYWIIPSLNTVVSIKLDHSVCDSKMFQDWVTKCITNRIQHINKKRIQTETGKVRFEFSDQIDLTGSRYSYRFDVRLRSLNTSSAKLKELASKVTHIIRRDTIKLNDGVDERPEWVKIFDKIPLLPAKPKSKTRQIEVRAEAKPSVNEIKKIIEEFSKEERKPTEWNNVGFETEKGTIWVDKYRLHETVNFNKDSSTVFPAADMHARLNEFRDRLLKGVISDEESKKNPRARGAA